MQVRALSPAGGWTSYLYFRGVTAQRAIELARLHCAATCTRVAHYEVRDDCYADLNEPPLLVAPEFASEAS